MLFACRLDPVQRKIFYNILKRLIKILPPGTIKSLTREHGKEFAWYQKIESGLRIVLFCRSPQLLAERIGREYKWSFKGEFPEKDQLFNCHPAWLILEGSVPNKQPAGEGCRVENGQECFAEELRNSA